MTLRVRLTLTILVTAIPLVGGLMWLRRDVERRTVEETMRASALAFVDHNGWRLADEDEAVRWGGDVRRWYRRPNGPGPEGRGPGGRRGEGRGRSGRVPPKGRAAASPGLPRNSESGPGAEPQRNPKGRGGGRRPAPPVELAGEAVRHWIFAYDETFTSANPLAPVVPEALREALSEEGLAGGTCRVTAGPDEAARDGYEILLRVPGHEPPCAFVLFRKSGGQLPSASSELLWASIILCGVLLLAVLVAAGPIVGRIRRLAADVRSAAADRYVSRVPVGGNDEIADLASAFNDAGAELRLNLETIEHREQALRRFVRNTTHDVMIPLTVLQGDINDLRKRVEKGEPPDRERIVQALEEAHYMGSLLHNLSAVAKLEGGEHQLQMHPVDLNALVQRASERHRPMAHMRGIELEYGVPDPVLLTRGDLTLIEQAVSNVIQNAVRYNNEGGHVAVILEAPRNKPGAFSVQVIDDGPGIAPEEMANIADRRFRGESARTRNPEGSGLGLNIARDVAERHGMTLTFRDSEYGGLQVELAGPLLAGAEGA